MGLLDQSFFDSIGPETSAGKVNVTIRTDGDCFLRCDGEFIDAEFKANKITKVELETGQHILEFQLVSNPDIVIEKIVDYPEKGRSYLEIVQGLREKTAEEKKVDAISEFKEQIRQRLSDDRRIDSKKAAELEDLRKRLDIDPNTATRLINEARRDVRQGVRGSMTIEGKTLSIDVLKKAVFKNDVEKVRLMLPDVECAIETSEKESQESQAIQCWYYMCLNALDPKGLIKRHETSVIDNYWRSFWVYLAYSRNKLRSEAADIISDLKDIYLDYPEANIDLLLAIDALNNISRKDAIKCMASNDDSISPEVIPLAEAIKYELGIEKHDSKQSEQKYAFFQDLIVSFETPEKRAARKEKEKEELRKKITYTLSITDIKDKDAAIRTMRERFGWAASVSTYKFSNLPLTILVSEDSSKALSLYESLVKGGITLDVSGVNVLGENVKDCLGLEKKAEQERLEKEKEIKEEARRKAEQKKKEEAEKKEAERQAALNRPLYLVRLNCKSGFIDKAGKEVIRCKYDFAYDFKEGLARVEMDGKTGYINKAGEVVVQCFLDKGYDVRDGIARIRYKKQYLYIDKRGNFINRCAYKEAGDFIEGMAKADGYFINKAGRKVFKCPDHSHDFSEGLSLNTWDDVFLDKTGREVFSVKEGKAYDFSDGVARIRKNDKYGYIDKTGQVVVPCEYKGLVNDFSEGLAVYRDDKNSLWGYVDKKLRKIVPCKYSKAFDFKNGMARVQDADNRKYGYYNKSGAQVVSCKYEDAFDFSEGLARVMSNGKYGYIDMSGKEVISCKFDDACDFHEGLARVGMNEKYTYIDTSGKAVTEFKYDVIM